MKLSDWLNPVYGANPGEAVRTHVHTAPFRHAVFPNFFRADVVHEIARRAESILTSPGTMNDGIARRAAVEWGPYLDKEVLRFFCGKEFREFMTEVLGDTFVLRRNWLPQLAHFHAGSQGYDIHNDTDEPRDGVLLMNLTQGYPEGGGGELCLYDSAKNLVRSIEPRINTLVMFRVSEVSWHSIADMRGEWVRRNVLLDWDLAK